MIPYRMHRTIRYGTHHQKLFSNQPKFLDPQFHLLLETGIYRDQSINPQARSIHVIHWIITLLVITMTRISSGSLSPNRAILKTVSLFAFCRLVPLIAASASEVSKECERLEDALTYTQEEAPRDLSSVVSFY